MSNGTTGRTWKETCIAAAALAGAVVLLVYFPDRDDGSGAVLGGISALLPVALALKVVVGVRPLPRRSLAARARLLAIVMAIGVALGFANLGVNYGMAALDPSIYQQMVTRWAKFSPWSVVIAEPIIEEIAYRLVLVTGAAWLAARFTNSRRTIFCVAVGVPALLFGVAHIFYGGVDSLLYAAGIAAKTTSAGVLLGSVFWKWGLPYSAVCHCVANGVHLLMIPVLF